MDFCAKHRDKGVLADSPDGKGYLKRQSELLRWAKANRNLTAEAFFELLNCRGRLILDNCHNSISQFGGGQWLHRKGAACAEGPEPIIVAGSRGSCSYLVEPVGEQRRNLYSIAHGAGRKWTRQSAHGRMEARHTAESLRKTKIGSLVVCPDKKLLYEEAPDAYKRIEQVVQDLLSHGLVRVAASFKPLINCKP